MSTILVLHTTRMLLEADLLTAVRDYSPSPCLSMGDIAGSEAAKEDCNGLQAFSWRSCRYLSPLYTHHWYRYG